jgi:hypothetical protein
MEIGDLPGPDEVGPPIYTYSRAQALADGYQVDASRMAKEAGIRFPVFLTRAVYDPYVKVPAGVAGQDEAGRLWDVVWMLRFSINQSKEGQDRLPFSLYVRNDNRGPRLVNLVAVCGALDFDDLRPAITVMLPDED